MRKTVKLMLVLAVLVLTLLPVKVEYRLVDRHAVSETTLLNGVKIASSTDSAGRGFVWVLVGNQHFVLVD